MSPEALRVWQRLQTVTEVLRREVGRGLQADAGLSDSEFAVLAHLVELGGSARPSECARAMGWESSRLAHQLGRLERNGLILRVAEAGADGRASTVTMTDAGLAAHRQAVGPHLRAARLWFADALDEAQLAALDDVLAALEDHARAKEETRLAGSQKERQTK
ncbi:MarR family winged helix-turn-helix transcriptional regulator [Microbacterium sp. P03]|uniref:MarR family winged helix-turn-helix transcriptional regulator n=1 Tax=Microbacterium sp. P03 TaxID=3366946 RepID=UPI003745C39C